MKWLRVALLVCALPLRAEIAVLDNLETGPQKHSQWCWAAVSSIAISAFPVDTEFKHLEQLEVAARRFADAKTLTEAAAKKLKIDEERGKCLSQAGCNRGAQPLLFDISSDRPKSGTALAMQSFLMDIKDRKRPVIIRWMYGDGESGSGVAAFGTHALIVTGVNTDAKQLRIYDPLPMNLPAREDHETWIPFEAYLHPSVHEGRNVFPLHAFDQFRMRRKGDNRNLPRLEDYPRLTVDPVRIPTRPPGGFEDPRKLGGVIGGYIKKVQDESGFLRSDGARRSGDLRGGVPIPVVTITVEQLLGLGSRPPESLLKRHAHAYIVPVVVRDEVVDSFQLLPDNGAWKQGGYSSKGIATLLNRLSVDDKARLKDGEDFYLVSIPEVASYYIAHGFGPGAQLKSLNEKVEYDAGRKVLNAVIQLINHLKNEKPLADTDITSS